MPRPCPLSTKHHIRIVQSECDRPEWGQSIFDTGVELHDETHDTPSHLYFLLRGISNEYAMNPNIPMAHINPEMDLKFTVIHWIFYTFIY